MQTFIDFVNNNYIWFIVGGVILVLAIIGFFADRSKTKAKALKKAQTLEAYETEDNPADNSEIDEAQISDNQEIEYENSNPTIDENDDIEETVDPLMTDSNYTKEIDRNDAEDGFKEINDSNEYGKYTEYDPDLDGNLTESEPVDKETYFAAQDDFDITSDQYENESSNVDENKEASTTDFDDDEMWKI